MESINERVSSLIKATGLSTNAFAKKLGKPQSSVAVIADGRSKPGFELLELICSTYPDVSRDWLLMGEGEMYRKDNPANPAEGDYLKEHIVNLEESFRRLSERFDSELLAKNQQIAGLQRTVDALVGKSEGVTLSPLSPEEIEFHSRYNQYNNLVLGNQSWLASQNYQLPAIPRK
ncbi:helix-turn-helix transcriptional regulator [uncultured Spirosoma sp.]|uniref:helix-turn-helix domain-containing protein n=1 Tax=uncultured Spirosoma sp. TaxID=278208 RepID=UPI002584A613|nr:helix-turn-helix transcriptional regulator [uncultured Spirosoma sp.]